jgi:proline dehydrogenase
MIEPLSRAVFHTLAASATVKRLASRYGMREGRFARRFIAGERVEDALDAARALADRGIDCTLNRLGESVTALPAARGAADAYARLMQDVRGAGLTCQISVKLTQLGLAVDPAACEANLRRVLDAAGERCFVRIDMEQSQWVDPTLDLFERVWRAGHRNVGVVLQSYLYRTADDLARVNALGARVRLCKGAYQEDPTVAWPRKADVDASFVRLMQSLLQDGVDPAFATHDPDMIAATRTHALERPSDRFEFQMLFGVRRDLQARLVEQGHRVRVYVPFGREWFPYFMRRLGERPANVLFVLRSLFHEGRS